MITSISVMTGPPDSDGKWDALVLVWFDNDRDGDPEEFQGERRFNSPFKAMASAILALEESVAGKPLAK